MLSILIPIYNFDVTSLVIRLAKQCEKAKISYEIICFDDGSRPKIKEKNQVLRSVFRVNYVEMSENLGRAKIRNWLAKAASLDYLLFLDCDSKVPHSDYIKNYVSLIPNIDLAYGGRSYSKNPPRSPKKKLHWLYGSKREAVKARVRQKDPYLHFMTNNFIIKRNIFESLSFDKSITQYGYEDTLFAFKIRELGVKITHVNNPLEHKGLETTEVFIEKQKKAIENLGILYNTKKLSRTRLIDFYNRVKFWKALPWIRKYYERNSEKIMKNLKGPNPKLRNLQVYKLMLFDESQNKKL